MASRLLCSRGVEYRRAEGAGLGADTRGVSSTEYLSLAAFGALAVLAAFAAFGDTVGGGLFAGGGDSGVGPDGSDGPGGGDRWVGGGSGALRDGEHPGAGGATPGAGDGWLGAPGFPGIATVAVTDPSGGRDPAAADTAPVGSEPGGSPEPTEPSPSDGSSSGDGSGDGAFADATVADAADSDAFTFADALGYLRQDALGFEEGAPWPLPGDRADAAEIFAHYGLVPTPGDVAVVSDDDLQALTGDPDIPAQLRAAALVENNHRVVGAAADDVSGGGHAGDDGEESGDGCSGWLSWCKVKEIATGTLDFADGVIAGVSRGAWYAGKFVFKAGEYALRLAFESTIGHLFGYTPTIDKIEGGIAAFIDDPRGSLETGREMAKAVGGHFADLGRSCTTEFTARGCGEAVGEIGFDVALTVGTGGVGGAAKGVAKLGSIASRGGASRTASALAYTERGLLRFDAAARATGQAALRGYARGGGFQHRWNPVPGANGRSWSFFRNKGLDRLERRWDRHYLKPDGDEFVIGTHGALGGRFIESPLWRPRPGVKARNRLWSHRELSRWMHSRGHKPGQPIRLFSCSTGADAACIAQDLANATRSRVIAPSHDISTFPGGMYQIRKRGEWVEFRPGGRRSSVIPPRDPSAKAVGNNLDVPVLDLVRENAYVQTPNGRLHHVPGREALPRPQPKPQGPLP